MIVTYPAKIGKSASKIFYKTAVFVLSYRQPVETAAGATQFALTTARFLAATSQC